MIPISTDAPIYHYPVATVSCIVLNVLLFLVLGSPLDDERYYEDIRYRTADGRLLSAEEVAEEAEGLEESDELEAFFDDLVEVEPFIPTATIRDSFLLEYGSIKPWQWVTCYFMHMHWFHLVGNMFFLWAFGLIVEGKVGAWVFTILYLGVGIVFSAAFQIMTVLFHLGPGYALGASTCIFGLLAFCVAWAPANEFEVIWFFFVPTVSEISILLYGALFVGKELLGLALGGFEITSELAHLLGFAIAFPAALWMVKTGRVDCEGWDIFSYMTGNLGKDSKQVAAFNRRQQRGDGPRRQTSDSKRKEQDTSNRTAIQLRSQIHQAIESGELNLAIRLQEKISASYPGTNWKQEDLYRLIHGLLKERRYQEAIPFMERHLESFEVHKFVIEKLMIRIWLGSQQPEKALAYVRGINAAFLTAEEKSQLRELAVQAKKMLTKREA